MDMVALLIVLLLTPDGDLRWEAKKLPDMAHCEKAAERTRPRFPAHARIICVEAQDHMPLPDEPVAEPGAPVIPPPRPGEMPRLGV